MDEKSWIPTTQWKLKTAAGQYFFIQLTEADGLYIWTSGSDPGEPKKLTSPQGCEEWAETVTDLPHQPPWWWRSDDLTIHPHANADVDKKDGHE